MARPYTIPDSVLSVIALFDGPLAEVRFPEIDRDTLLGMLDSLRATLTQLEDAERQIATLQKSVVTELEAIGRKSEQGLQYARVYAEGDTTTQHTALAKQVGKIASPRDSIRQVIEQLPFTTAVAAAVKAEPKTRKRKSESTPGSEMAPTEGEGGNANLEPQDTMPQMLHTSVAELHDGAVAEA